MNAMWIKLKQTNKNHINLRQIFIDFIMYYFISFYYSTEPLLSFSLKYLSNFPKKHSLSDSFWSATAISQDHLFFYFHKPN